MLLSGIKNILSVFSGKKNSADMDVYWKKRAEAFGARAVVNLEHKQEDFEKITEEQKKTIFPVLKQHLTGKEKTGLDFGCGPARFSKDIAALINGKITGVDVVPAFIQAAKANDTENEYCVMRGDKIPAPDNHFDLIWICLVLGGIAEDKLENVKKEILRVSKKDALLILVENTTKQPDNSHWFYRDASWYVNLFSPFRLGREKEYDDLGETISILAGRRQG